MALRDLVEGRWRGRLVDVQGFEGELSLELQRATGGFVGSFRAAIGGQHETMQRDGAVRGALEKDRLRLVVETGEQEPVTIQLDGQLIALRDGGVGLAGTYEVATRGFSPLKGGIISANKDRPAPSILVGGGTVSVSRTRADAPRSGRRTRATTPRRSRGRAS